MISVGRVGVLGVLGTEGVLGVPGAVEELPEEELSEEEGLLLEAELLEDGLLLVEEPEEEPEGLDEVVGLEEEADEEVGLLL